MNAEAKFLKSRETRRPERKSRTDHHPRHEFWSNLKAVLADWKNKLMALVERQQDNAQLSEDNKRQIQLELLELQQELNARKKESLAGSLSLWQPKVAMPALELSQSDLRQLHNCFSECQSELDRVQRELLPRRKFVFRRYREALRNREEMTGVATQLATSSNQETKRPASETLLHDVQNDDPSRAISQYREERLFLHADGSVVKNHSDGSTQIVQRLHTPTSCLVLRDLDRCEVTVYHSLESLHLISLLACTVRVEGNVRGAIHVTGCQETTLFSVSQQLRLHDSRNLECHSHVSAGAILEDCIGIVFYGQIEVKDFNWLQQGLPSPNYRIELDQREEDDDCNEAIDLTSLRNSPSCSSPTRGVPSLEMDEVSDDDEL